MEQTSKSLSFLLMASSKWMNKKWKRKQFTFSSSKLPTGECFAYFAYLHFLVVIWSTLGGIGNAGFVVSRAFNLLQADNLLFCTAWESDPGLITLTFKLCALLDNNHFVIKKIILQSFVQKTSCSRTFCTPYMSYITKYLNTMDGKVI